MNETRKLDNADEEDHDKSIREEEMADDDLSNWVFETYCVLHTQIEEVVTLTEKMHLFSATTRNVHKDIKNWCAELKVKMKSTLEKSKALEPYVQKAGDRILDLSSSFLEVSTRPIPPAIETKDKETNTEPAVTAPVPTIRSHTNAQKKTLPSNQPAERESLREGKRKKAKMKPECNCSRQDTTEGAGHKDRRRRIRNPYKKTNNEAVVVRPSGQTTYAEVAKKLKTTINVSALGVNIKGMKKAKSGDLILQIDKGPKQEEEAARLKEAVAQTLGADAVVNHTPRTDTVKIRDLDSDTTIEEITQAVVNTTGTSPDSVKVIRMLPSYGGNVMAVIKMKHKDATMLQSLGRLTVGLVRCRIKLETQMPRCYKCHNFGHFSASCRGPNRTALCMTCGDGNHKAKDCKAPPRCVLCKDSGHESGHYPGSQACREFKDARKRSNI